MANAAKQNVVAKWDTDRKWQPIERKDAAAMLRGNRRNGRRVIRQHGESRIFGYGLCFVIRAAA